MFVEDVKGRNNVMVDHVNEDIVMAHVGIVDLHMVSVLLSQAVITLYCLERVMQGAGYLCRVFSLYVVLRSHHLMGKPRANTLLVAPGWDEDSFF